MLTVSTTVFSGSHYLLNGTVFILSPSLPIIQVIYYYLYICVLILSVENEGFYVWCWIHDLVCCTSKYPQNITLSVIFSFLSNLG